jgi:hypothetical protein
MSRALVALAERGVEAEAVARARLAAGYEQFMAEEIRPGRARSAKI